MLKIGGTDDFESRYTEKFRALLKPRGEFVKYERDYFARDIGVHLTRPATGGGREVTAALCWFQLKGTMATTLTQEEFLREPTIGYSLKVTHLRYWYAQAHTTYLALYVDSVDTFLVLNIQKYVEQRWGRAIFDLKQETVTIEVPRHSILDDHAIDLILNESDQAAWGRVLGVDPAVLQACVRDPELIWRIGSAGDRDVFHRVLYTAWISKIRTEVHFEERKRSSDWVTFRISWQRSLPLSELEAAYPYLEFFSLSTRPEGYGHEPPQAAALESPDELTGDEDDSDDEEEAGEDEQDDEAFVLKNGDRVYGNEYFGEHDQYVFGVRLNELGWRLYDHVCRLVELNFLHLDLSQNQWLVYSATAAREV